MREKNTARVNLRLLRYELRKSVNGKCSLQVFCSVVEMEIKITKRTKIKMLCLMGIESLS